MLIPQELQLSQNLGGKIWVDKNYKEGARFVFTHPLNEK